MKAAIAYLLVAAAFGYGLYAIQSRNAGELYENQIAACQRGNVMRSVLHGFADDAGKNRTEQAKETTGALRASNLTAAANYFHSAERLSSAPYARPDGTTRCTIAIRKP